MPRDSNDSGLSFDFSLDLSRPNRVKAPPRLARASRCAPRPPASGAYVAVLRQEVDPGITPAETERTSKTAPFRSPAMGPSPPAIASSTPTTPSPVPRAPRGRSPPRRSRATARGVASPCLSLPHVENVAVTRGYKILEEYARST